MGVSHKIIAHKQGILNCNMGATVGECHGRAGNPGSFLLRKCPVASLRIEISLMDRRGRNGAGGRDAVFDSSEAGRNILADLES